MKGAASVPDLPGTSPAQGPSHGGSVTEERVRSPRWRFPVGRRGLIVLVPLVLVAGVAYSMASPSVAARLSPPTGAPDSLANLRMPAPTPPTAQLHTRYLDRVIEDVDPHEQRLNELADLYNVTESLARMIYNAALEEGLDPELGFRLIRVESVFDPDAIGAGGATGLCQLMPGTARDLDPAIDTRRELLEPRTNLRLGFGLLREMLERYEEHDDAVRLAVLAYNRGEVAVDRALRRGADPENGYGRLVLGARAHGGRSYSGPGIVEPVARDTAR